MLDLYEELAAVVDTLERRGIEYAVRGGLAMSVHGFTRATDDIDLLVPPAAADAVEDVASDLGYTLKARPMSFNDGAMQIRRVTKIDTADGDTLTLDLLLVTPASRHVWESRQRLVWRDRPIHVVSREGLISLERFRSSKQDLADIEHLENGA